jgi:hypothetical protein
MGKVIAINDSPLNDEIRGTICPLFFRGMDFRWREHIKLVMFLKHMLMWSGLMSNFVVMNIGYHPR